MIKQKNKNKKEFIENVINGIRDNYFRNNL